MSRLSILDLPKPQPCYDIGLLPWFETAADALAEDRARAQLLCRPTTLASELIDADKAAALAGRLGDWGIAHTPAASRFMRLHRRPIVGALWKVTAEHPDVPVAVATIMPRGWERAPEQLEDTSPLELMERFRAILHRRGSSKASGGIFGALHAEFDPISKLFKLHMHLAAFGGMVDLVDGLRGLPSFKAAPAPPGRSKGSPRVRMSWGALDDPAYRLGYVLQGYWPSRAMGDFREDGVTRRQQARTRIPEPFHSAALLWLDRWSLLDLTLTVGLQVTADGFQMRGM